MDKVNIRTANRADFDTISQYYQELYKGDERSKFSNSDIQLQNFRSGESLLVAEINHKLVGYLWFVWYEHIEYKGVAYIEELYTDKEHRRMKVGTALINRAKSMLRELKIDTIYFAVGKHMKDAQDFYISIGFRESDELWFEGNVN